MNAGKTVRLLGVAFTQEKQHGKEILVVKPQVDTKGGNSITSRAGDGREADIVVSPEADIRELIKLKKYGGRVIHHVLVDEAQFLQPEQVHGLYLVSKEDGVNVSTFGLLTDFQTNFFPGSETLMVMTDRKEEIYHHCRCGEYAVFNARKDKDRFIKEGPQVAIDNQADTSYEALCRGCYIQEVGNPIQVRELAKIEDAKKRLGM